MQVQVHRAIGRIPRETWDGLLARAAVGTVFQSHGWTRAWLSAYRRDADVFVVTVHEGDELVAVAPFHVEIRNGRRVLLFIGEGRSDYADIICERENLPALEAVFDALKRSADLWDEIELNNMPESSAAVSFLQAGGRLGLRRVWRRPVPCPTLSIRDRPEVVDEVLAKQSIKRHFRHFAARGDLEISHHRSAAEILPLLNGFYSQHIQRWVGRTPQSLFLDREARDFYRALAVELAPEGRVLFTVVSSGGRPIAYHYGLISDRRLLWYKPAFEVLLARHGPGEVLLRELLVWVRDHGLDELDFTRGGEAFKSRFANLVRWNWSVRIASRPLRGVTIALRNAAGRSVAIRRLAGRSRRLVANLASIALPRTVIRRRRERFEKRSSLLKYYEGDVLGDQFVDGRGLKKPEAAILNLLRAGASSLRMLDIGVGAGRTTPFFAGIVGEYTAIDNSEAMVHACRERVGDLVDPQRIVEVDARRLTWANGRRFDFVLISFNTLDCVPFEERPLVLQEVRRILEPGGRLAFSSHNLQSLSIRPARGIIHWLHRVGRYRRLRAANGDLRRLRDADTALVRDASGHYHLPVCYIRPRVQVEALANAGFAEIRVLSLMTGEVVEREAWDQLADSWVYYLCCRA